MNGWVVDTCVVLDVALNDVNFGATSPRLLQSKLADGLLISPVTFVELAPSFHNQLPELKHFLHRARLNWHELWTQADTEAAFEGWGRYVQLKRQGLSVRRPVADLLIGAFASRFQGLITRNPGDFQPFFPRLQILTPTKEME